jgi:hypothetical protein
MYSYVCLRSIPMYDNYTWRTSRGGGTQNTGRGQSGAWERGSHRELVGLVASPLAGICLDDGSLNQPYTRLYRNSRAPETKNP